MSHQCDGVEGEATAPRRRHSPDAGYFKSDDCSCEADERERNEEQVQSMIARTVDQLLDLSAKAAIVTGGASGMGKAVALRLAEAGASVMLADLDEAASKQTVKHIRAKGGTAAFSIVNAGVPSDAKQVVAETVQTFGRLDLMVNSPGVYPPAPVLSMTEEVWDKALDANLRGIFFFSQSAAQEMTRGGRGGKIINIATFEALHPVMQLAHYNASKGGLVMLTKALAMELAPHRILVNAVAPGIIRTPGFEGLLSTLIPTGQTFEELTQFLLPRVPLFRIGEPDDVAKIVLCLASSAADYVTGQTITVDGGYLLS
jgi:2-deoxy-D-gluconate 3-dehydrogenase